MYQPYLSSYLDGNSESQDLGCGVGANCVSQHLFHMLDDSWFRKRVLPKAISLVCSVLSCSAAVFQQAAAQPQQISARTQQAWQQLQLHLTDKVPALLLFLLFSTSLCKHLRAGV